MASHRLWLTLLLLGLLALAGADVSAEDSGEDAGAAAESEEGEEGPLAPSEFAQTVTLFPDFPDKKFVLGDLVDVLCGFTNVGDKSFNITQMKGSLNSAKDYQYVQNFTEVSPFWEIKKGEQGTMAYRFLPDPKLDPKEYILTLSIDYIDADKDEYRTVYFNSTVEIIESQSSLESRTFFGRIMFAVVIGVVAYFANRWNQQRNAKKAYRTAATSGPKSDQSEWLEHVNLPPGAPRRSNSGNKKAGSKTKSS